MMVTKYLHIFFHAILNQFSYVLGGKSSCSSYLSIIFPDETFFLIEELKKYKK